MSAEKQTTERIKEPWWVRRADHMKGWEAFGVTSKEPLVRRLGTVTFVRGKLTTVERPNTTAFGPGEVRLGVAGIEFATYADAIDGAYLHVLGTTEADVTEAWHRAAALFAEMAPRLWAHKAKGLRGE